MIRFFIAACLVIGYVAARCQKDSTEEHCIAARFICKAHEEGSNERYPNELCYQGLCFDAIRNHTQVEFDAAFRYMDMGAYFAQSSVGRPGMTKFMLDSASEERQHGIQMLDYVNKRGIQPFKYQDNFSYTSNVKAYTVLEALKEALEMEIKVTRKIHGVINHCDKDFHAADVFTNPILEEQHDGIRKLQGAIQDLENQILGLESNGVAFVEFLFDQKLLKEGL